MKTTLPWYSSLQLLPSYIHDPWSQLTSLDKLRRGDSSRSRNIIITSEHGLLLQGVLRPRYLHEAGEDGLVWEVGGHGGQHRHVVHHPSPDGGGACVAGNIFSLQLSVVWLWVTVETETRLRVHLLHWTCHWGKVSKINYKKLMEISIWLIKFTFSIKMNIFVWNYPKIF